MSDSRDSTDCSLLGSSCPWNSPGKNTGVDCHFLLQGIFLTQEFNLCLLYRRQILYRLSYQEVESTFRYFRKYFRKEIQNV